MEHLNGRVMWRDYFKPVATMRAETTDRRYEMNDWKVFKTRSKDERAYERRSVAKSLMAAGHTRAVALKKAKSMVK